MAPSGRWTVRPGGVVEPNDLVGRRAKTLGPGAPGGQGGQGENSTRTIDVPVVALAAGQGQGAAISGIVTKR